MRYTKKQRELLYKAWNRGYLSDSKSYGAISDVTGLSRKQISNWARYQIKKLGNKPRPKRSNAPLTSIFKNLPRKVEEQNSCAFPVKAPLDTMLNFSGKIPSKQKPTKQTASFLSTVTQNMSPLPGFPLQELTLPTKTVKFEDNVRNWLPVDFALTAHGYTQPSRVSHLVGTPWHPRIVPSTIPNSLSPFKRWILFEAVKNVKEIDDAGMEDLERLTSIRSIDIACHLLSKGWKAKPAVCGIRYLRT